MIQEFISEKAKRRFFGALSSAEKTEVFQDILRQSSYTVFLGGAGVSTESGIPDFRSRDGLYHKTEKRFQRYKPEYLLSYECLRNEPQVFFDYYRKNLDARAAEPNAAHRILAKWEKSGLIKGVITQNIDGLHQKAGSVNVQEIHGTTLRNHCVSCRKAFDQDFIFDSKEIIPKCPECGSMVRPDVTLYGEFLPEEAYQNAISMIREADCLIIGGTSLEVGSASGLAHTYHGKYLIIINKTRTKMEGKADLVFHGNIGNILEATDMLRHTPQFT